MSANLASIVTDQFLRDLNEILPSAGAQGAYFLGRLSVTAVNAGREPSRADMEAIVRCATVEEADDFCTRRAEGAADPGARP